MEYITIRCKNSVCICFNFQEFLFPGKQFFVKKILENVSSILLVSTDYSPEQLFTFILLKNKYLFLLIYKKLKVI